MMISQMLKNRTSFEETHGVFGRKTCRKQEKVNWKSPGPGLVQGFWLKNFSSFHGRVRSQLKECLDSGFKPHWLTKGRTAILWKDKSKDNVYHKCGSYCQM